MAPQLQFLENSIDGNDVIEIEDNFVELPVRFRSIVELKDDDGEADKISRICIGDTEIQERDLRHAEELRRHAEELERLHKLFEEANQRHHAEINSLEQRFHDASQKREDLLEQALGYAERLEASSLKKINKQVQEVNRLQGEIRNRDARVEKLQMQNDRKDRDIRKLKVFIFVLLLCLLYAVIFFDVFGSFVASRWGQVFAHSFAKYQTSHGGSQIYEGVDPNEEANAVGKLMAKIKYTIQRWKNK